MVVDLIKTVLAGTYNLLNSIYVPGFNVSFLQIMFGGVAALASIGLLKLIFGLGNSSAASLGRSIRGGNNNNIKISKDRRGDTN